MKTILIILFVTIVALSTTLVTTEVMAQKETTRWYPNGTVVVNYGHVDISGIKVNWTLPYLPPGVPISGSSGNSNSNSRNNPDMTKACQSLQDIINIDRDIGADSKTVNDIQKTHDDSC
jgi:hypothetical protein